MRTVSLTCLVCKTLVYRITQAVVPGTESGEGMVLPTEDWVENEVLRSASGWIEVSKDILVRVSAERRSKFRSLLAVAKWSGPVPSRRCPLGRRMPEIPTARLQGILSRVLESLTYVVTYDSR